ncbi:MAG: GNAT family N-acetyltransferase [Acidobacteriota bacterium]
MNLRDEHHRSYLELLPPPDLHLDLDARLERLRQQLADGTCSPADVFVTLDDEDRVEATCRLADLTETSRVLTQLRWRGAPEAPSKGVVLIEEALARARELGLARISTRPTDAFLDDGYRAALIAGGFVLEGGRVEFKTPVDELPHEDAESLLTWRDLGELGWDRVTAVMARTSQDPAATVEQATRELRDFLAPDDIHNQPDCVELGFLDDEPVAFLCAQSDATGWGTISFMGLVPEARGRGLGGAVQRRGFSLLRRQGAALYHDGTESENHPMLALFARHGCREHARMTEWEWTSANARGTES